MTRVLTVLVAAVAPLLASAQATSRPRQTTARTTPAAPVADTTTTMFTASGISVIHRRLTTSDIVVAQIYLLGGSRQLTYANAGIESLMLSASEFGTRKYPGRNATRALSRTGSTISVGPSLDWSVVELRTIRNVLDSAWSVFADRIANPELSSVAVSITRDRMLAAAQYRRSDPDALITLIADSVAFAGHPYAIDPAGNERSLAGLTASDVVAYHKANTVTSRMLLVIVGNVAVADVQRLVAGSLARLPRGSYQWTLPPELPQRPLSLAMFPRRIQTNYLLGYFPGPPVGSREHPAFRVATALLSGKLSYTIREEFKLSYAAYAPFKDRAVASGGIYVSTTRPDAVYPLIKDAMSEVMNAELNEERLPSFLNQFSLEFLLDKETYDGQASELARAHLLRGDFRQADAWLRDLQLVTPTALQSVARRYFDNVQYVFLGDTAAMRRAFRD